MALKGGQRQAKKVSEAYPHFLPFWTLLIWDNPSMVSFSRPWTLLLCPSLKQRSFDPLPPPSVIGSSFQCQKNGSALRKYIFFGSCFKPIHFFPKHGLFDFPSSKFILVFLPLVSSIFHHLCYFGLHCYTVTNCLKVKPILRHRTLTNSWQDCFNLERVKSSASDFGVFCSCFVFKRSPLFANKLDYKNVLKNYLKRFTHFHFTLCLKYNLFFFFLLIPPSWVSV